MLECKIVIIVTATLNKPPLRIETPTNLLTTNITPLSPPPPPEGLNRGYTEFLPAGVVVGVEMVVEAENKTKKSHDLDITIFAHDILGMFWLIRIVCTSD